MTYKDRKFLVLPDAVDCFRHPLLAVVMATGNSHDYKWINEDPKLARRADTRAHSRL